MKDRIFIGDRYEVLSKVGAGGMADVYKGKDHKLNRFVAIKVLKKEFREDETFVRKFQSEAQAAAGLMHPNIVNVYDVGEDQGLYYMVMELVEGITLKEYINKKGALSAKETISIAIQAANGIEAAHMHHIVHRDIKPQNIIISKEGKVKVTDFGIAKAASSNTISTNVLGSVHYTSPEQARGGYSDYKSDIYSLGITMYEMVTGTLPFDGDSAVSVAIKHLQEEITPPSERMDGIPYSLEQIILKCTQKNADRRYPDVKSLKDDLKRSLVDPDGDFVTIGPMRVADETVLFSADDVSRIKNESGRYRDRDEYDDDYDDEYDDDGDEYDRDDYDDDYDDEEYEDDRRRRKSDDVNPKMAKIMKILTIVAVVIILFVMVFIVGRATGLLKFGPTSVTEEDKTEVKVPKLVGMTQKDAEKALKVKGLKLKVTAKKESAEYEEGYIISQDPKDGSKVKKESVVNVVVSSGKVEEEIEVQDVSGKTQDEARDILEEAGFVVAVSSQFETSSEFDQDEVIRTTPKAGTKAKKGSEVTLIISSGEDKPEIPNLLGKTESNAGSILSGMDINYTTEKVYNEKYPEGQVCYQSKKAGTRVERGSSITLQISKGKKPEEKATVPPLTGKTLSTAKSLISSAGLITGDVTYEYSDDAPAGTVIGVTPGEGSSVSLNTKVDIVISNGPEPQTTPEPENPDGNEQGEQ